MNELLKNILTVLKDNGPLKASEIAKFLGKTKKDLNPTLYAALRKLDGLMKSDKDVWSYEEHQLVNISFDCSASWLSADIVEQKLRQYPDLINQKCRIEFDFSDKFLLLDCILKILSLVNQLANTGAKVVIKFAPKSKGFSYLQRCGFFDNVDETVTILPYRPKESLAKKYNSNSDNLFEIFKITHEYDDSLLDRIAELVGAKLSEEDVQKLLNKLLTLIGELVDNIREHGLSAISGYIALQIYNSGKIMIAISDSGSGLIHTLRTEALNHYQDNDALNDFVVQSMENDIGLLGYVFNHGNISRTGETGRGLGLSKSNNTLKKLSHDQVAGIILTIRQQDNELSFPFNTNGIEIEGCRPQTDLMYIAGTHYVLTIVLDKMVIN